MREKEEEEEQKEKKIEKGGKREVLFLVTQKIFKNPLVR